MLQFHQHKGGNHHDTGGMSSPMGGDDVEMAWALNKAGDVTLRKRQVEGKLKDDLSLVATKLYKRPIEELEQDQLVLCEIWAEIKKMKSEVFSELKGLSPHPTEEVFMTQTMDNKLDGIFQTFSNTTNKLELDMEHKPYFVDENPAYVDVPAKRFNKWRK